MKGREELVVTIYHGDCAPRSPSVVAKAIQNGYVQLCFKTSVT
jgi:hypothetical protein